MLNGFSLVAALQQCSTGGDQEDRHPVCQRRWQGETDGRRFLQCGEGSGATGKAEGSLV